MKKLVSRYDKNHIALLPKILFQGRIVVVQSEQEIVKAVSYLKRHKIIGIDTETKPVFKKGRGMNPVALLQVSTHDTCFLFRLTHTGLTDELIDLLTDERIVRVGLSLKDDFMQLCRRRVFVPGSFVELQSIAKEMGIVDQSLQKLYANFFEKRISKSQQLTNWEADVLTEAQKRYAATDAWACIQIYEEMQELDRKGYMLEIIPEPEPPEPPVLTPEEIKLKEERKKASDKRKRERKRIKEKEARSRRKERSNKEIVKNMIA